jgi:glycosyltransferase involved in cell wall biosynthesis
MGLPVVATPQAIDGLRGSDEVEWRVSDDPAGLAALAVEVMNDSTLAQRLGESGRRHVLAYYGWDSHMARFERLLEGGVAIVSGQRSMA